MFFLQSFSQMMLQVFPLRQRTTGSARPPCWSMRRKALLWILWPSHVGPNSSYIVVILVAPSKPRFTNSPHHVAGGLPSLARCLRHSRLALRDPYMMVGCSPQPLRGGGGARGRGRGGWWWTRTRGWATRTSESSLQMPPTCGAPRTWPRPPSSSCVGRRVEGPALCLDGSLPPLLVHNFSRWTDRVKS